MQRATTAACICSVLGLWACGGEPQVEAAQAAPSQHSSGAEEASPASSGMQVEGILGKIPERRIEDTLSAKLPAFQRCFAEGMGEVELLAGKMKFYFRVGLDGQVEWVMPRESSVGHRSTELCLLDVAKRVRFPKPQGGGAAEFAWGFEIDATSVRAPVQWSAERIIGDVAAQRTSLDACGLAAGRYMITVYVAPGGGVLAAGASADSREAADKIDCLVTAVRSWHLPDPGSYAAKVSFEL